MRVLIAEDESAAARNLQSILESLQPDIEIAQVLDTVTDSIEYLRSEPKLDLIFMDIHLADGESFRIFDHVNVSTPVVFTTAYDQYALEAFRVSGIDYLLKPLNEQDVQRALEKWRSLTGQSRQAYTKNVEKMAHQRQNHVFLVHFRDRIIPLKCPDIAFFYTSQEKVYAYTHKAEKYQIEYTLEALQSMLPEDDFYRANRQYIISRQAVKDISVWFGSRLNLNLKQEVPEKIIISKARVHDFKQWLCSSTAD